MKQTLLSAKAVAVETVELSPALGEPSTQLMVKRISNEQSECSECSAVLSRAEKNWGNQLCDRCWDGGAARSRGPAPLE